MYERTMELIIIILSILTVVLLGTLVIREQIHGTRYAELERELRDELKYANAYKIEKGWTTIRCKGMPFLIPPRPKDY